MDLQTILVLLFVMLITPVQIYVGVKLGTYAYYRGRFLFYRDCKEESEGGKNGDEKTT